MAMPDLELEKKDLDEAVYTAIGAASVCWENMAGTGIFQDDKARSIAEQLKTRIAQELGRDSIDADTSQ